MPLPFHFTPPPPAEVNTLADFIACSVLSNENRTEAVTFCQRVFERTKNPYSLEDLIRDAFAAKRLEVLKKILPALSDNKTLEVYKYEIEALLALANGNEDKFYEYAKRALAKGTENPTILLNVYRLAVEKKDYNTIVAVLKRLHELFPYNDKITDLLLKLLPPQEKLELLEKLVRENPSPTYYTLLVKMLIEKGDLKEAEKYLKAALRRYPSDKNLKKLYIETEVQLGKVDEAKEAAHRWGMVSTYYLSLVDYYADNGNYKGLKSLIDKTLKEEPGNRQLMEKLLLYSIAFGFSPEEIEKLGNVYLKLVEQDFKTCLSEGNNGNKTCKVDRTTQTYILWALLNGVPIPERYLKELVFQNRSGDAENLLLKALISIKEHNTGKALSLLRQVDPQKLTPYWKRVYDALSLYTEVLTKHSLSEEIFKNPQAVLNAVDVLYNLDRDFARKALLQYVNTSPSLDRYRNAFQIAYSHGDIPFIVELFKSALKRYPTNPWVLNTYAYTLLMTEGKKAVSEACPLLEKAVKEAPKDPSILDSLGWCYYLKGELRKADLYLKKALKLSEGNPPVILYHYAKVLQSEGKPCEALEYAKRALEALENTPSEPEKGITKKVKTLIEELKVCTKEEKHSLLPYSKSIL